MHASVRGIRIYFDVEGAGLVPDGPRMRERPVAMVIHGGRAAITAASSRE